MPTEITQRELRNESGEIMRRLDNGESFLVTRNGVPVAELTPHRPNRFVPVTVIEAAFRTSPLIDLERLREDLEGHLDLGLHIHD